MNEKIVLMFHEFTADNAARLLGCAYQFATDFPNVKPGVRNGVGYHREGDPTPTWAYRTRAGAIVARDGKRENAKRVRDV